MITDQELAIIPPEPGKTQPEENRLRTTEMTKMAKKRDTYKYQFKLGNKIVHGGITNDLERRELEHQQRWPNGHIKQVGRRTTEEAARAWEEEKGYTPD